MANREVAREHKHFEEKKPQLIADLRPPMRDRFIRLEAARIQMDKQGSSHEQWFNEVRHKMDYLVEQFLTFAHKEGEFRRYLRSNLEEALLEQGTLQSAPMVKSRSRADSLPIPGEPPMEPADQWVQMMVAKIQAAYDFQIESMQKTLDHDPEDLNTNAVLQKRKDVIRRRHDYVAQIGRILSNLNHQLELIEDTFGLINDEIRATSPEQILADIDDVIYKADALNEVLNDISPANQLSAGA